MCYYALAIDTTTVFLEIGLSAKCYPHGPVNKSIFGFIDRPGQYVHIC